MSGFKTIPRRTFLQGLGATMGLPLLDGMKSARAITICERGSISHALAIAIQVLNFHAPCTALADTIGCPAGSKSLSKSMQAKPGIQCAISSLPQGMSPWRPPPRKSPQSQPLELSMAPPDTPPRGLLTSRCVWTSPLELLSFSVFPP